MKINKVSLNNRKKVISIETRKGVLEYPFAQLDIRPTSKNKIVKIFVDAELANEAVTYYLESGKENSVHLDAFLEYNQDPDYLRMLFLFELTVKAQKYIKKSKLSKNAVCRRLKTSASQLARLLDQTNNKKSVDKMLELLAVLGVSVKPDFEEVA
jgi:predicted XRE-type DNA-binding protein